MTRVFWSFRTALAWVFCVVAFVVFSAVAPGFASTGNLYALLATFAVLAVVACGLAMVMIAGEFDLSIAGMFPLAGLVAVKVGEDQGVAIGIAAAVVSAAALGLLNGYLTAHWNIPSLAVTVGTLVFCIGIGFAVAGDNVVILTDFTPGLKLDQPVAEVLSIRVIIQVVLALLAALAMAFSWLGLSTYAGGSDRDRAKASGLPVTAALVAIFTISAVFTGVAGSLQAISLASGQAGQNDAILLQAVTACIIGGISIAGGRGSLFGVIGGALLLAIVSSGLSLQGTSTAVIQLVNGSILLAVVLIDRPLSRAIARTLENSRTVIEQTTANPPPRIPEGSTP